MEQPHPLRSKLPWLVALALALGFAASLARRDHEGDLRVFYDTAARPRQGLDLYHLRETPSPTTPSGYIYPPPFAWVFSPLTYLPFSTVRVLWATLMGVAAVRCYALALRLTGPAPPWVLALGLFGSLRFVLSDLGHGQVNILVLWLTLEGCACAHTHRDRPAGLWLGAAVALKLTPLLLVAAYALARRPRIVLVAAASTLAWLLLPALSWGLDPLLDGLLRFVTTVTPSNAHAHACVNNNASLYALLHRALLGVAPPYTTPPNPSLPPASVYALGSALSLSLAALVLFRARTLSPQDPRWYAGLLASIPLISPVAWKPHLVVLILPALWLAHQRRPLAWIALLTTAGTSRLFLGRAAADAALLYGVLTLGIALHVWIALGPRRAPPAH